MTIPDVENLARKALAQSHVFALQNLNVSWDGERLSISGRVDSFYHKQMAQELVRAASGNVPVVNGIEVAD